MEVGHRLKTCLCCFTSEVEGKYLSDLPTFNYKRFHFSYRSNWLSTFLPFFLVIAVTQNYFSFSCLGHFFSFYVIIFYLEKIWFSF